MRRKCFHAYVHTCTSRGRNLELLLDAVCRQASCPEAHHPARSKDSDRPGSPGPDAQTFMKYVQYSTVQTIPGIQELLLCYDPQTFGLHYCSRFDAMVGYIGTLE